MHDKRDTHSEKQLPLEFEALGSLPNDATNLVSNVVRVQFGAQKNGPVVRSDKEQALIERILQSAQKLKW